MIIKKFNESSDEFVGNIFLWMEKYNISSMNLEHLNIKEIDDEEYIIKSINFHDQKLTISSDIMRDKKLSKGEFINWKEETWEKIWNYLKNLTSEEIDAILSEKEAEKFNF